MISSLKPLVVVFTLAWIVFALARPVCLKFMEPAEFARRRNVWFVLTCTAFAAPDIWVFAAVALPVVYWAASVDRHPTALYLLLLSTVPPAELAIPFPLINKLFELSPFRILALALLLPTAVRILRSGTATPRTMARVDLVVLAFGALQLALYVPYESVTNTLRRALLFGLDTYLLYFVFSRGASSKTALRDTMACFCLACVVLVPITVFESAKGWLMFEDIPSRWGAPNTGAWLLRGDSLRAQGPAGHSLTMGYIFSMALGFWLYVGGRIESRRLLWGIGGGIWLALFATYARGAWIAATTTLLVYLLLSPSGRRHFVQVVAGLAAAFVLLSLTPQGAHIIDTLPFIGTSDQENVEYRQRVATTSWQLIRQNPLFGNPFAANYMEDLRQGQGIIDIVNVYASMSLFYGLVGCGLFVACLLYPTVRAFVASRAASGSDTEGANLGAALVACMLGTLLILATASYQHAFAILPWVLAGLCSAYTTAMSRQVSSRSEPVRHSTFRAQTLTKPSR